MGKNKELTEFNKFREDKRIDEQMSNIKDLTEPDDSPIAPPAEPTLPNPEEEIKTKLENAESTAESVSRFIGVLFQSRDLVHLYHLKTKSYPEHIALNAFYDSLLEHIDAIAEKHQGLSDGRVEIIIPETKLGDLDIRVYLRDLLEEVRKSREYIKFPVLTIILDDIDALIIKTLYLLSLS